MWSASSTTGIESFERKARHIVIFADNDENFAGQARSVSAAHRLALRGIEVEVVSRRPLGIGSTAVQTKLRAGSASGEAAAGARQHDRPHDKATKSSAEIVFGAIQDLHVHEQIVTLNSPRLTGLKLTTIDGRLAHPRGQQPHPPGAAWGIRPDGAAQAGQPIAHALPGRHDGAGGR